tara:strand:+ start:2155 stop:3021 length:867 start_codon:yes stop_codon:yes gene_type:complete
MEKKLITICIPVYNEESNIVNTIQKLEQFFLRFKDRFDYEILFSDNNSEDDTIKIIEKKKEENRNIRIIKFNNNIGYDLSVYNNLLESNGEACVVIDCDLQDPIDLIETFLDKWEEGYDLVYGVRIRKHEPLFFYLSRKFFYMLAHFFSKKKYPLYAGDFRLIDRSIINKIKGYKDVIFTRCITFNYSKKYTGIEYSRIPRKKGVSKFKFLNALIYALKFLSTQTYLFQIIFGISYSIGLFLLISNYLLKEKITLIILFLLFVLFINLIQSVFNLKLKSDQKKFLKKL